MLSSHKSLKLQPINPIKNNKPLVLSSYLQQRSLNSYWLNKDVPNKQTQVHQYQGNIKQSISNIKQSISNINDENCSYNANIYQHENLQNKDCIQKQNTVYFNLEHKQTEISQNHVLSEQNLTDQSKMVSMKKKIKKCSNHSNASYNFFREKVTFKKKMYKFNCLSQRQNNDIQPHSQIEQQKMQIDHVVESFYVYRDSDIFPGLANKQFTNRIVTQRMDNDTETDDEQVEKFVKRISGDFLAHLQKVKKENDQLVDNESSLSKEQGESNEL